MTVVNAGGAPTAGTSFPRGPLPAPSFNNPGGPLLGAGGLSQSLQGLPPNSSGNALTSQTQQSLLGGLGHLLPQNAVLRRGDVPLLEAGLNFDSAASSQRDRNTAISRLATQSQDTLEAPEAMAARQAALQQVTNNPMNQGLVDQQIGATRSQQALTGQVAQQDMAQNLAAQGLQGGVPAMALAQLQQQNAAQNQQVLADLALQGAGGIAESQDRAISGLVNANQQGGQQQLGYESLIAQLLSRDPAQFDLSGLVAVPPGSYQAIGPSYG